MKTLIITLATVLTVNAHAALIKSANHKVDVSGIDQVFPLVNKADNTSGFGTVNKKVQIVTLDGGMSTDVSPRYTVYISFKSMAEMGNLTASFKITDQAFQVIGTQRISAGIYQVITQEYTDEGMLEVTYTLDTVKMFSDEKKARENCGLDFCDGDLKTVIDVKKSGKKL